MRIELMKGRRTGKYIIVLNDTRIAGIKDGYGYTKEQAFEIPDEKIRDLLSEPKEKV